MIAYRVIQPTVAGESFDLVESVPPARDLPYERAKDHEVRIDLVNGADLVHRGMPCGRRGLMRSMAHRSLWPRSYGIALVQVGRAAELNIE